MDPRYVLVTPKGVTNAYLVTYQRYIPSSAPWDGTKEEYTATAHEYNNPLSTTSKSLNCRPDMDQVF